MQESDEMFFFQISDYGNPALDTETVELFRQRLEACSRNTVPFQWDETDQLDTHMGGLSRWGQWVVYGILLAALAVVALIPGLMESRTPTVILLGSVAAIAIFLAVCLVRQRKPLPVPESCRKEAREFLAAWRAVKWHELAAKILFDEGGMTVFNETRQETVSYERMTGLFETEDFCLLAYDEDGLLLLQRRDLVSGNALEFLPFLHEKIEENSR